MSKYGGFSGPYFPVFGLNTGKYGTGKYGLEKAPYLDTFHAVNLWSFDFQLLMKGKFQSERL